MGRVYFRLPLLTVNDCRLSMIQTSFSACARPMNNSESPENPPHPNNYLVVSTGSTPCNFCTWAAQCYVADYMMEIRIKLSWVLAPSRGGSETTALRCRCTVVGKVKDIIVGLNEMIGLTF